MKLIILDPHSSDFIWTPLSYVVARKRPLLKYEYLSNVFDGVMFTGKNSSLPKVFTRWFSLLYRMIFSWLEIFFWIKFNRIKKETLVSEFDQKAKYFTFGYKNINEVIKFLIEMKYCGCLFVHLSHYHTFKLSVDTLSFEIIWCADNDLSKSDFFNDGLGVISRQIITIPFSVNKRFFQVDSEKELLDLSVGITGTVHVMPIGILPFECLGFSTLHPTRLRLFFEDNLPFYVKKLLSKFDSNKGFIKAIFQQKKYYSTPIDVFYRNCTHSIVASEGNGLIAIGLLESMASGCIPILSRFDFESLSVNEQDIECLTYSDYNDLIDCLLSLKRCKYNKSEKNRIFAEQYLPTRLSLTARKAFLNG